MKRIFAAMPGERIRFRTSLLLMALALTGLPVGAAPASGADLPARVYGKAPGMADPGYNWSGFYAGVNAGYGVGSAPTSLTVNDVEANFFSPDLNPLPGTLHPSGFTGGGQIGFNYQLGSLVTGLEADLAYARLRKTDSATGEFFIGGTLTTTVETRLDWFGTVRARLGVLPTSNLLLYATGGLAYGNVQTSTTGSNLPVINCVGRFIYWASGSTSGISVGWTAGGGIEYAFAPDWTFKTEYLYLDLGNRSVTFPDRDVPGSALTTNTSFTAHIIHAGLNRRF
jgi:outer membrane immunogenic protein